MPIFYQKKLSADTDLAIWEITEPEFFFAERIQIQRQIHHSHKRLQHLAGRWLLPVLSKDFPVNLIQLTANNRPYLPGEAVFFSISHCGNYAAAITSISYPAGIDIELENEKLFKLQYKFLNNEELDIVAHQENLLFTRIQLLTLFWSAKESVFKWYALGGVDFKKDICLLSIDTANGSINGLFTKTGKAFTIYYRRFGQLVLTWVVG